MSRVWVLGAGQLGAMLKHAAQPLGVDLVAVDIEDDSHLNLAAEDMITAEREQWPSTVATDQLAAHTNFVNRDVFGLVADRVTQKQMLDRLNLPTAPWQLVEPGVQVLKRNAWKEVGVSYHFLLMALDFQAGLNRSMNLVSVVKRQISW